VRFDHRLTHWFRSDTPWVWLNAGALALALLSLLGILLLIATRGLAYFWPPSLLQAELQGEGQPRIIAGEVIRRESLPLSQLRATDNAPESTQAEVTRTLIRGSSPASSRSDFFWVLDSNLSGTRYPEQLAVFEPVRWGRVYGYLHALRTGGEPWLQREQAGDEALWQALAQRQQQVRTLQLEIDRIENTRLAEINRRLEALQLEQRRLTSSPDRQAEHPELEQTASRLEQEYVQLQQHRQTQQARIDQESLVVTMADGRKLELPLADLVRAYRPNRMTLVEKLQYYGSRLWEFLSESPRAGNTEGGVFPALFGTVLLVLLMSVLVTPFGVLAAVYLNEYAHQGLLTRTIRIAVHNLAGVPSIVYGIFGLGFFVYFLGGSIDALFFPESLPVPTFGTGGLLWASATLALLTLPVVIVATEEGLRTIPVSLREGALALGATRAETLWKVVLPAASPAMMTGVILAIARAAGEVAPLMLVGVVKLVPRLPVDGNFPYLHLDQKFMHLGFHIYDVGFHSASSEAAQPLVYATALLLLLVILLLNLSATLLRSHLRARFRALEPEL